MVTLSVVNNFLRALVLTSAFLVSPLASAECVAYLFGDAPLSELLYRQSHTQLAGLTWPKRLAWLERESRRLQPEDLIAALDNAEGDLWRELQVARVERVRWGSRTRLRLPWFRSRLLILPRPKTWQADELGRALMQLSESLLAAHVRDLRSELNPTRYAERMALKAEWLERFVYEQVGSLAPEVLAERPERGWALRYALDVILSGGLGARPRLGRPSQENGLAYVLNEPTSPAPRAPALTHFAVSRGLAAMALASATVAGVTVWQARHWLADVVTLAPAIEETVQTLNTESAPVSDRKPALAAKLSGRIAVLREQLTQAGDEQKASLQKQIEQLQHIVDQLKLPEASASR